MQANLVMKLPGQDQWHVVCPVIGCSSRTKSTNFFRSGSTNCGMDVLGVSYGTCLAIKAYMTPCSLLSFSNFCIVKIGSAGDTSDVREEGLVGKGNNLIFHPFQFSFKCCARS